MPIVIFLIVVIIVLIMIVALYSSNDNKNKDDSGKIELKGYITADESQGSASRLPLRRSFRGDTFPSEGNYTVIDTETTGLDACVCEILEIGAIRYRNNLAVNRFHSYIRPKGTIPKRASDINHITWEKVCNAPSLSDVYSDFISFIGTDILVGYNIDFDIKFIQTRTQTDINNPQFDVLQFAKDSLDLDSYKLSDLKRHFNISGSSHSAIDDCLTTAAVFQKCLDLPSGQDVLRNRDRSYMDEDSPDAKGFQYWAKGEEARILGDFETALNFYGLAQAEGYATPDIYTSYAMLYRKQKDYESEISIINEALSKFSGPTADNFQYRKSRAESLLIARNKKDMELKEKELKRKQKEEKRQREKELEEMKPQKSVGKAVVQYSDDGTIIKEFSSISKAAAEIGVSSKSIRAAATGAQKHAGGYCWKFADEVTP